MDNPINQEPYIAIPIDNIYWELYQELKHLGYEDKIEMVLSSVCHLIFLYSDQNLDMISNDIEGIVDGFYHDLEESLYLKLESIIFKTYHLLNDVFKNYSLRSEMFKDKYGECYYSRYQFHGLVGSILIIYDYVRYIQMQDNYEDIFAHLQ